MTLQKLKELSEKRIINMKRLYEEADRPASSMRSRISHMNGSLSQEEVQDLELAAIRMIEEVAEVLDIDKRKIAYALELPVKEPAGGGAISPCAYYHGPKKVQPVYLISDKVKKREADSGTGDPLFWKAEKIHETLVSNPNLKATGRGRELFA